MAYSKMITQFETQSLVFTKLRMGLPYPKYIVRGYDGHVDVFKTTTDTRNPEKLLTIQVRPSLTAEEVGFFRRTATEYLLIGRDAGWTVVDEVKKILQEL